MASQNEMTLIGKDSWAPGTHSIGVQLYGVTGNWTHPFSQGLLFLLLFVVFDFVVVVVVVRYLRA